MRLPVARPPRTTTSLRLGSCAIAAAVASSPTLARAAYEESRVTADTVRVTLAPSGLARIEHKLTWRVVAGQPKGFDLIGAEPGARVEPDVTFESDDGRTIPGSASWAPGKGLRVSVSEPRSLRHGQQYRLTVAYGVDLVEAHELVRESGTYKLIWHAPTTGDAFEAPRVTFVLPPALEPPAALMSDEGMRDDGVAATLKRAPDHDEVDLVRPHVGRGEDQVWAVRVDARAFDGATGPAVAAPPPPPRREAPPGPGLLTYAVLGSLSASFAALVARKGRRFDANLGGLGASRGVVPLRSVERAALAGASLFGGMSLQFAECPWAGALLLGVAMAASVLRPGASSPPPRGPGRWLILRPDDAFAAPRRRSFFGLASVVAASVALALSERLLRRGEPDARWMLALDALVLVPALSTGLASQVPPQDLRRSGPWLRRLYARLRSVQAIRVSPWGRLPTGRAAPDEVRLLVLPREPMPGLSAIEVGLSWRRAITSFVASPEILVRVQESTAASARMTSLVPSVVPVTGRRPEERVFRLAPALPTERETRALVIAIGRRLIDRRVSDAEWVSEDRRAASGARVATPPNDPAPVPG